MASLVQSPPSKMCSAEISDHHPGELKRPPNPAAFLLVGNRRLSSNPYDKTVTV
jgi:hypothetical protein